MQKRGEGGWKKEREREREQNGLPLRNHPEIFQIQ